MYKYKYDKYKKKYLQLKHGGFGEDFQIDDDEDDYEDPGDDIFEPDQESDLSITIDGITFKILYKFRFINYKIVALLNMTNSNTIYVYKSNSELGMLRLALWDNHGGIFIKGLDYVASTFIHYDLQRFIKENYAKLTKITKKKELSILFLIAQLEKN